VPPGFVRTAESDVCDVEAMSDPERGLYGVQWHPEVAHTAEGEAVFEAFVDICRAHATSEAEASAESSGI
jgi:GMP synthase (glutamine-hydrolysing)